MYFITLFETYKIDKTGVPDIGEFRTIGYYSHFTFCEEDLNKNLLDMRDGIYNYAVIEKIPCGLYSLAEERHFYKWDKDKEGFYRVEDDAAFKYDFFNYAFG